MAKTNGKPVTMIYQTRTMRADLLDRVRVVAAMRQQVLRKRQTVEATLNEVVALGLPLAEAQVAKLQAEAARVAARR